MFSRGKVGVAEVTGGLEHSDNPLHVTGEAETVVSHDQQLYNYRRGKIEDNNVTSLVLSRWKLVAETEPNSKCAVKPKK